MTSETRLARFGQKRHGAAGYDAYQGRAQSWCFRCDSDHAWSEACPPVIRLSRKSTTCPTCAVSAATTAARTGR